MSESYNRCEIKGIYLQAEDDYFVSQKSVDKFKEVFDEFEVIRVRSSHFLLQTNPQVCAKFLVKEAEI